MSRKEQDKPTGLETALRLAVEKSGMSAHAIARRSGIDVASLLRFMNRQRTMTLPSAGRLAASLGLELRSMKRG